MRGIEHRIQMVNDEQTHVLRKTAGLESLARLSGFTSTSEFEEKLRRTLTLGKAIIPRLFESAGELGTDTGKSVFSPRRDDPKPLKLWSAWASNGPAKFRPPSAAGTSVATAATPHGKSKERLTELMPQLLLALPGGERTCLPRLR